MSSSPLFLKEQEEEREMGIVRAFKVRHVPVKLLAPLLLHAPYSISQQYSSYTRRSSVFARLF
jgi:hypothetical protein